VISKNVHCSVLLPLQVPKERLSSQKEHGLMRKSFPKHYPIVPPIIQPSGASSNLTCKCNIQTWITNHSTCWPKIWSCMNIMWGCFCSSSSCGLTLLRIIVETFSIANFYGTPFFLLQSFRGSELLSISIAWFSSSSTIDSFPWLVLTCSQLLEGPKFESQIEDNGKARSRGTLLSSQHLKRVKGCAGASGWD
jgi:hypothetical protein